MFKEEYSPYKIIHHLDKIIQLKNMEQTVPIQIQLVPTNICNQNCIFCAYRMKNSLSNQEFNRKDLLSYEKVKETLVSAKALGVKAIHYTGGGEPLTHPNIKQMFIDTIDNNLELALVSNGQALSEEICEFLGANATWVRISVDAATSKRYNK